MSDTTDGPAWCRSERTVWRVGVDRVLVLTVGAGHPAPAILDLTGAAALVWVALDEPADRVTLAARLHEFDVDAHAIDDALATLVTAGVVERIERIERIGRIGSAR